ncbi:PaaI family thioesterase [Actinocorallia sp. API 0066]|uniref:PaaI family thioesterase n=1 Tax=Actinocorallia sp. API 0066 TaxID=2896846 RepID=UPI001E46BD64|nr:PaaI family thioesterase [Actinocorallia sp. API 0066]MCD0448484.1 PaaI family thioesterase [Actinocorallia sp. API 0066]
MTQSPAVPTPERPFLGEARVKTVGGLADEVRALIDAVVFTDAPDADLEEAAAALRALTERLNAARLPAPPMSADHGMLGQLGNPVTGVVNPVAPPIPFEVQEDGSVTADFTLGDVYEGPPGYVHGGISAAVFDQLLGMVAASSGTPGMTATLDLRYRRPTPLNTPLRLEARVARREGRKTWVEGTITTPDGRTTVESTAMFITPRHFITSGLAQDPASR